LSAKWLLALFALDDFRSGLLLARILFIIFSREVGGCV
jgi:hypothetical protein